LNTGIPWLITSLASAGTAARIVARILLNVPRAGSGTRAKYSSTLFGAPVLFLFTPEPLPPTFAVLMRGCYKNDPIESNFV
jgi:hypothetical protein